MKTILTILISCVLLLGLVSLGGCSEDSGAGDGGPEPGGKPQSSAQLHRSSPEPHSVSPQKPAPGSGVTSRIGEAGRPAELTRLLAAGLVL